MSPIYPGFKLDTSEKNRINKKRIQFISTHKQIINRFFFLFDEKRSNEES